MYGCTGALDLAEEPEGEDAHEQADEGDYHAQLGDPRQDVVMGYKLIRQKTLICEIQSFAFAS